MKPAGAMNPSALSPGHPDPADLLRAWEALVTGTDVGSAHDAPGPIVLRGLHRLTTGRLPAEGWETPEKRRANVAALLPRLVDDADSRTFLAGLARRLLAQGFLLCPDEPLSDPLLNPQASLYRAIDPGCADFHLSLARATAAVELGLSDLLLEVMVRHLAAARIPDDGPGFASGNVWLEVIVDDLQAQCLIVGRLAASPGERTRRALQILLQQSVEWPLRTPGPLGATVALSHVLCQPRDWRPGLATLRKRVESWPGWYDHAFWPTRHGGGSPAGFKERLTQSVASSLGTDETRLWDAFQADLILGGTWPPLAAFGFRLTTPV